MPRRPTMRPFWRAVAIGLVVSGLMTVVYRAGLTRQLEAWSLDLRFRHTNRLLGESDRIRVVAIDDQSLDQVGRWPWPRRHLADLVGILHEAGASEIALDLYFPEPQRVSEGLDEPHALPWQDPPIDDDAAFADAIARAGNVYMPVVCPLMSGRYDWAAAQQRSADALRRDEPLTEPQFAALAGLPQVLLGPDANLRSRMRALLRERFLLDEEDLAAQLRTPIEAVQGWIGQVRRQVALERVEEHLRQQPDATLEQLQRAIVPDAADSAVEPPEIAWACERARSRQLVRDRVPAPAARVGPLLQARNPFSLQVSIEPLTRAAAGLGHVVVLRPDDPINAEISDPDGVVRRLPMLMAWEDRVVPQMALALAARIRSLDLESIRILPDRIVVPAHEGEPLVLPLDQTGQTLLNWVHASRSWNDSFEPIVPASYVLEVADLRRRQRRNEDWYATRMLRLVQMVQPTELAAYEHCLARARQADAPAEDAQRMREIESACIEILRQEEPGLREALAQAADDAQRRELAEYLSLHDQLATGRLREQIDGANARLRRRIDDQLARLRETLGGRTVFVGYTASALADFAGTPVWSNAPGVMTHAQALNTLLQNRPIRPLAPRANVSLVLLACLFVTLTSASLGPRLSLPALAAAGFALIGLSSVVLFERYAVATALATPLIGMFVTWAMITAYREFVEQRAKRHIARTLQQYTSPALARRMAEDPAAVAKAETREVTCFFSDLRGFTTISEMLGAEATQQILNIYLERMTEVLDRHEALINKFLGDGIFAFFNPAIHPQPDHARQACLAALEAFAALEDLKRAAPHDANLQALHMRVGLASGMAVVGNCGSERKFDYTCIGDTVNLASRLEPANKTFGTGILINARCRDLAGDGLACRRIGRLMVAGRAAFVEAFELLGPAGAIDAARREQVLRFEEAVGCFIAGDLARAQAGFEICMRLRPDDQATRVYLDLCRRYAQAGTGENWNGAIEIAGK